MPAPAPRDTAHKWLAFGAIVVVAVGTSFASRAFKNHLEETLPQPDPPYVLPPSGASGEPAPAPEPEEDPDEDAPLAGDPPIVPPGTPPTSAAARPSWATAASGWAPMHSRPASLFEKAAAPTGSLSKAFVLCRGRSTSGVQADVHVRAKLGQLPSLEASGADVAYVGAPLVDLKPGAPIEVVVSARQDGGLEPIARVSSTYRGKIGAGARDGDLECVALTGDALQSCIAIDAGRADSVLARLDEARLDPAEPGWGYPTKDIAIAQRASSDVAALAGWDDPRVKKRVDTYARLVQELDAKRANVFAELHRSASNATFVRSVVFSGATCTCDPGPSRDARCTVSFSVKNEGGSRVVWGDDVEITIGEPSGPRAAVVPEGQRKATIGPNETRTLSVSTSWRAQPGPAVAQIRIGVELGVLKLR